VKIIAAAAKRFDNIRERLSELGFWNSCVRIV
jgi:hypothetical protein